LNGEANQDIHALLKDCWETSGRYLPVEVIGQGDPREAVFQGLLVDDSVACGANLATWLGQIKMAGVGTAPVSPGWLGK
jgi:hypothetical protein